MTAGDFRRIALGLKNTVESAHMGHPDFRINGRIFASLHADGRHGMIKLTPEQQQALIGEHPGAFTPENGAVSRPVPAKPRRAVRKSGPRPRR